MITIKSKSLVNTPIINEFDTSLPGYYPPTEGSDEPEIPGDIAFQGYLG